MNIDIKSILPYLVIACSIAMSWGMISQRLEAVESKVDDITEIKIDLEVIKVKLERIEKILTSEK